MPNNPKKILIDARMAGTQNAGIGRSIEELIKNLIKLDTENEYYLFLSKENFSLADNWFYGLDEKRFHKILVDARWYTLKEQFVVLREIKKIKPDLIYFPHFNVPLFFRGKFIVTIHDLIWIKYPRPRKEVSTLGPVLYNVKNFFSKIVFRSAVKRAQKIITPTEFTKKDIMDFYQVSGEKIDVINWGINKSEKQSFLFYENEKQKDSSTERQSDNILKKCYNIKKPYLLHVGSAYPHKNLIFLLKVFKKIKDSGTNIQNPGLDFQLVLVGKNSYFYQKLKKIVSNMGLEEQVIFTDYVEDKKLDLLYKEAYLFIFPSLLEGFGLPPLEAMAKEVPVISSNSTCLPEILGDSVLYFNPENEEDLEEKILSIIKNENLRFGLIKKGFEQIRKYDWEICAKKYLEIINTL